MKSGVVVAALLLGAGFQEVRGQSFNRDPFQFLSPSLRGTFIHPCRAETTVLRACGDETTVTPVGRLSTMCQLAGPRLESSVTQRGNPFIPVAEVPPFSVPPYGAPGGWFEQRPTCWPENDPAHPFQLQVANLQLTYPPNASCDLDVDAIGKCDPFYDHRPICPEGGRITGGDLAIPVAFRNKVWFLFGDVSDHDAVPRDDDHNIVPTRSVQDIEDIDLEVQPCIGLQQALAPCSDLDFRLKGITLPFPFTGRPPGGCDDPGCIRYEKCGIFAGLDPNDPDPNQNFIVEGNARTNLIAEKRIRLEPGVRILPRDDSASTFRASIEPQLAGSVKHGISDDVLVSFMSGILEDNRDSIITGCLLDPNNADAEFRLLKRGIRVVPVNAVVVPDAVEGEVLWVYTFAIPPFFTVNGVNACGLSGLNLIGLARSTDGENYTPVEGAFWGPEPDVCPMPATPHPRFLQGAVFHNGLVYTYWSEGWRQRNLYIARVTPAEIHLPEEYEWLSVDDVWRRVGPPKFPTDAKNIITFQASDPHHIGEFSIQFNELINGFVAFYAGYPSVACPVTAYDFRRDGYRIQFSALPEGPFDFRAPFHFQLTQASNEANGPEVGCTKQWKRRELINGQTQCFEQTFFAMYGAYQLPRALSASHPETIYFTTSSFGHYNTFLMKLDLDPSVVPQFRGSKRGDGKTQPVTRPTPHRARPRRQRGEVGPRRPRPPEATPTRQPKQPDDEPTHRRGAQSG